MGFPQGHGLVTVTVIGPLPKPHLSTGDQQCGRHKLSTCCIQNLVLGAGEVKRDSPWPRRAHLISGVEKRYRGTAGLGR